MGAVVAEWWSKKKILFLIYIYRTLRWEKSLFRSSNATCRESCDFFFFFKSSRMTLSSQMISETQMLIATQTAAKTGLTLTDSDHGVMAGMLRDLFMMRRTSTSGRLSCLVWAQPSSAAAMCRSKRSDTDFFLSLGFPLKKEPSHCLITLSTFSVLTREKTHTKQRWLCYFKEATRCRHMQQ